MSEGYEVPLSYRGDRSGPYIDRKVWSDVQNKRDGNKNENRHFLLEPIIHRLFFYRVLKLSTLTCVSFKKSDLIARVGYKVKFNHEL